MCRIHLSSASSRLLRGNMLENEEILVLRPFFILKGISTSKTHVTSSAIFHLRRHAHTRKSFFLGHWPDIEKLTKFLHVKKKKRRQINSFNAFFLTFSTFEKRFMTKNSYRLIISARSQNINSLLIFLKTRNWSFCCCLLISTVLNEWHWIEKIVIWRFEILCNCSNL